MLFLSVVMYGNRLEQPLIQTSLCLFEKKIEL